MQNPYGAVPAALRDTRLTLRDIAKDILMEKKMEQDAALAASQQDVSRAQVMGNIEQQARGQELDLKRLGIQEKESNARTNLVNLQGRQLADDIRAANEVVTAGEFSKRFGAQHILPLFGIDPAEKRTASQWKPLGQQMMQMLNQSPYLAMNASALSLQGEIDELHEKLQTPGLDATARQNLIKEIKPRYAALQMQTRLMKMATEPSPADLGKEWAKSTELQLAYPDRDAYIKNAIEAHRAYRADEKALQIKRMTLDIDQDFLGNMRRASNTILSLADPKTAAQILAEIEKKQNAAASPQDYASVLEFARNHANHLQNQQSSRAAAPAPQNPPTQGQAPTAAALTPQPAAGEIPDMEHAGTERLRKVGDALTAIGAGVWNQTGGRMQKSMAARAAQQTADAQRDIAALTEQDQLTPAALEAIRKKYPYATIK